MREFVTGFSIAAIAAFAVDSAAAQESSSVSPLSFAGGPTVVLANPEDPYYELAGEIAHEELLLLTDSLEEALAQAPVFLLWVVSPDRLSDKRLAEFGIEIRESSHSVAMGIITGSSLEKARELYRRARDVQGNNTLIVNTNNRPSHRRAEIICLANDNQETIELSKQEVVGRLRSTDYLVFNGHGSATQFSLDEKGSSRIQGPDLPSLPPLVVDSRGCQTLRLWERNSIALCFVDQGAAAFAGYSISPMTGWGMKGQAPFRLSWAGFPIGIMVSVMNDAVQCNARVPCYYLVGDPRIAFHSEPPYTIDSDRVAGNTRIIAISSVSSGVVPLRIAGGAHYDFVTVIGVTSVSRGDLFGNSCLQMGNFGEDKYLLYNSDGRDFVCKLTVHAPVLWRLSDPILDSLDSALLTLYAPDSGTYFILAAIGCLGVALALLKTRLSGTHVRSVGLAMLAGIAIASCHGFYALLRLDNVTVTANPVRFYPVSVVSTFLMTTCGALFYSSSRSLRGRAMGAALASGVTLFAGLFVLSAIAVLNALLASKVGVAPWGSRLALSAGMAFTLQYGLCLLVFAGLRCKERKRREFNSNGTEQTGLRTRTH